MSGKSFMLGIKLPVSLHLCLIAHGFAAFNAVADVDTGVDVLANVMREGLIHLLVMIAALASLRARRAPVLA